MTTATMTCAAQATEAYRRHRRRYLPDRDEQRVRDVLALAEFGVFSNRHLAAITGMSEARVQSLTQKTERTGGRLNVDTLPTIVDLEACWDDRAKAERLLVAIVSMGTSRGMVAKVTGFPLKKLEVMGR